MIASSLAPLGVLLACASHAVALKISIASTVKADTDVTVNVRNDISSSDSFDAQYDTYSLFLATTPPGWGTGPACLLVNNTKMDVTSVKVIIPADAAPDGAELRISSQAFGKNSDTGFGYTGDFTFSGGKAEWSKTELNGELIGDIYMLPCTALNCARKCNDKYYDERHKKGAETDPMSMKNTYECVAGCPGAKFPSWQSLIDEYNPTVTLSATGAAATGSSDPTASPTTVVSATGSSTGSSTSSPTSASSSASPITTPNAAVHVGSARSPVIVLAGLVAVYGLF